MMSGGTMDVNQFPVPGSMGMPQQNNYGPSQPHDPPAAVRDRTFKRLDRYRESAKKKSKGLEDELTHRLATDMEETEKYHQKVNDLKMRKKTGRETRKDSEKCANGLRPDENNAIYKGIQENLKMNENERKKKTISRNISKMSQMTFPPVRAEPLAAPVHMFQEVNAGPFQFTDIPNLKFESDHSLSNLKPDEINAILNNVDDMVLSTSDTFVNAPDVSIKQEHNSGSPLYHDMQPSMGTQPPYHHTQSHHAPHSSARWPPGFTAQMPYHQQIDPRWYTQPQQIPPQSSPYYQDTTNNSYQAYL